MNPLTSHTGRAVVLRRRNVDTDQIVPAEFCKRVTRTGYADALFARWRDEPGFVLNRPDAAGAIVLLAGSDFGTGSSREHAVWALRDWGFLVVIASRFGDIFHRNALKNGLLAITLDDQVVDGLMAAAEADPGMPITVDLTACEVRADGGTWTFEIDDRARWLLLNGFDDIDVTLRHLSEISDFEHGRHYWLPTIARGGHTTSEVVR
nr:hypothetical protein [uncultured bacterium]